MKKDPAGTKDDFNLIVKDVINDQYLEFCTE